MTSTRSIAEVGTTAGSGRVLNPPPTMRLPFHKNSVPSPGCVLGRLRNAGMANDCVADAWPAGAPPKFRIWGMLASRSTVLVTPVAFTSSRSTATVDAPTGLTKPRMEVPVTMIWSVGAPPDSVAWCAEAGASPRACACAAADIKTSVSAVPEANRRLHSLIIPSPLACPGAAQSLGLPSEPYLE